jgi:hypothetical protein
MLGREDGFDAIAVLDSFHLVLVILSPSLEVRGSEDDYDSLMCGLLGYIFACPCGPRFKAMFTLRGRLRDRKDVLIHSYISLSLCLFGTIILLYSNHSRYFLSFLHSSGNTGQSLIFTMMLISRISG